MPNARPSVGTVSSFDLEPNPFEQSFASTKKDGGDGINSGEGRSASASASVSGPPGDGREEEVRRSSSMNFMGDAASSAAGATTGGNNTQRSSINVPGQGEPQIADQRRPSPLLFGSQRAASIQSPPILTPGGSKKLPPLLMSPTYLQNQQGNGQMPGTGTGTQTPLGGAAQPNETDSQLPGFLMNLFKSGLTPNESNLRANFTPGILSNLPALGGNGVGLSRANSNANILPNGGDKTQEGGSKMNGQIDIPNKALTALGGLPGGQLTPGLTSFLAGSGQPLVNQTPGGKTNPMPTNSYFPVAENKKDDNSDVNNNSGNINNNVKSNNMSNNGEVSNTDDKEKAVPKKRGRKKGVTNKDIENKKSKMVKANSQTDMSSVNKKSMTKSTSNQVELNNAAIAYNNGINDGSDDQNISLAEQERRRQEFLERNRVAASRFRRKKKEYIKKIEADLNFYQEEYDEMSRVIGSLAGITPEGSEEKIQGSILLMAEQALLNNDIKAAMQILESMKQTIAASGFVKRNGTNPRLESKNQNSD